MRVKDPLIELLAIKLYEHDSRLGLKFWFDKDEPTWAGLPEEDRESYRRIARGEEDYGYAKDPA